MTSNKVRIQHIIDDSKEEIYERVRFWVNDVEIVAVVSYDVQADGKYGGHAPQKFTIEMFADVSIEHVKKVV